MLDRPAGPAGPDLSGLRVAVLGAAFKPNTDDIRDSPALSIVRRLSRTGAEVTVYDPEAMTNAEREVPEVAYAKTLTDAVNRRAAGLRAHRVGRVSATSTRRRWPSSSAPRASSTA